MADADMAEGGVPRDGGRHDEEIAFRFWMWSDGDCSWYW